MCDKVVGPALLIRYHEQYTLNSYRAVVHELGSIVLRYLGLGWKNFPVFSSVQEGAVIAVEGCAPRSFLVHVVLLREIALCLCRTSRKMSSITLCSNRAREYGRKRYTTLSQCFSKRFCRVLGF